MPTSSNGEQVIRWGHTSLTLGIAIHSDAPPSLDLLDSSPGTRARHAHTPDGCQPIAEVLLAGDGRVWSGTRSVGTAVGTRLRYTGHTESSAGPWMQLRVSAADQQTGLAVEVFFRSVEGHPALQTWTCVTNESDGPVVLHAVSSLATSAFLPTAAVVDDVEVHWARSDWLAESRWHTRRLRDIDLPDIDTSLHGHRARGCMAVTSDGSWSTSEALPTGALHHRSSDRSWAWQVEHNGAWRWEVGECRGGLYLAASGPTDTDHQWRHILEPGARFTSVPVGLAFSDGGLEGAVAALTAYRRALVRPHPDRDALPVVFNDYMNTLMGDPTAEALLPLLDAAAQVGAEYFCIDAGWHDNTEGRLSWDMIGAWEPSTTRFPDGLARVVDRIRDLGMVPGLWLEPEVIGVRSPVAHTLPDEAFFLRDGRRQVEDGRYHLDMRHPAAAAHLDAVVDRLVAEFGIGYFKLDYNIDAGPGTEVKAAAPGDGLLGHCRAYVAWLEGVLDRHPELTIENCASGAMRMDYAILSRLQLQSTSDQQNLLRYPPIAAAAPMSVLPEQSASWAYPQPDMSDEEIAFCIVTGMMGRLYLSGHLDRMSTGQRELVAHGVAAHKAIRAELARTVPTWPLGLPGWADPWVTLGLRPADGGDGSTYLAAWQRPGASPEVPMDLPHLAGRKVRAESLFPAALSRWELDWDAKRGVLTLVTAGSPPAARLLRLTPEG